MKSYLKLAEKFETISRLNNANAILGWDNAVMIREGSAAYRAQDMAALSAVAHHIINSSEVSDLLDDAEQNQNDLDEWQKANLKLIRHSWKHSTAVPEKLLKDFSVAGSKCELHWRQARNDNDYKTYAHFQKPVLEMAKDIAGLKAQALGLSKYDALLDQYDAGRRSKDIDFVFADLESFLPSFIQQVLEKQRSQGEVILPQGKFPIDKQESLGRFLMDKIGFDFNKGRLDVSSHPFCGGTSTDVRITTRYDEGDFTSSLMGVLHETGHALYEMGLPADYNGQPVGEALGMTIHESQSLLMEMQVCRSKEFVNFVLPHIVERFGDQRAFEAENFYKLYNKVEPSLIRVDADEVTYPIHVIIRYKLEKAMVNNELQVDDLPSAWNELYKNLLGVNVPDYKNGCLQDIHWADGSYGYFPTYTLGAITASQLFASCKMQNPTIMDEIGRGNFNRLVSWLRENIHSKGSLFSADKLIENVTGEALNAENFKNYLKDKYLG